MKIDQQICAWAFLAAVSGCADTTVVGSFGDRELHVAGTAFGWIDATEYVEDVGGGTPVLADRRVDATVLHLRFTEATFDPRVDLRALPRGERQAILEDIARGDQLAVDVRRGNAIRPGDDVQFAPPGTLPPEVLPFISAVSVTFGEPVVGPSTKYPDRVPQLGTDLSAELEVDESSPELAGVLRLEAKKASADGDGFLEGSVEVAFHFELLAERLAECNFAPDGQGVVVDPCTGR